MTVRFYFFHRLYGFCNERHNPANSGVNPGTMKSCKRGGEKVKSSREKAGRPRPPLLPNLHTRVKSRYSHEVGKMKMMPAA